MTVGVRSEVMAYALRQDLKRSIDQCKISANQISTFFFYLEFKLVILGKEFAADWEATPPGMTRLECNWLWRKDFDLKSKTHEPTPPRDAISFSINGSKETDINRSNEVDIKTRSASPPPVIDTSRLTTSDLSQILDRVNPPRAPVSRSPSPPRSTRVPPALPVSPGV